EGLDNALMLLQHRLESCPEDSTIEIVRDYGNLPPVQCYPGKLNQVFMNILANAIDALQDEFSQQTAGESTNNAQKRPKQVHIRTSMVDDARRTMEMVGVPWIEIAIANNGPSVPESLHHTIFEPFFTTKPVGQGTGMGLPISYQIIAERHRGQLTIHSSEGNGTEFVIQIPIDPLKA
ncbi:MAG: HAMP domain-containing histidine kinase, partial [Merismopedia sp. SIO2A8]|nr:HAMP domain-containing histidine kinase [Merismopedia sp. SIO2A8]